MGLFLFLCWESKKKKGGGGWGRILKSHTYLTVETGHRHSWGSWLERLVAQSNQSDGEMSGQGDGPRTPAPTAILVPFLPRSEVAGISPAPSMSAGNGGAQTLVPRPHFCIQGRCVKLRKVIFQKRQLLGCRDLSDQMTLRGPSAPCVLSCLSGSGRRTRIRTEQPLAPLHPGAAE